MNKILSLILIVGALCINGCTTPKRAAFVTTGVTVTSVQTALKVYDGFVARGKISLEDELKVKNAYEKYQASVRLVRLVAVSTTEPNDNAFEKVIKAVEVAREDLLKLIFDLTK